MQHAPSSGAQARPAAPPAPTLTEVRPLCREKGKGKPTPAGVARFRFGSLFVFLSSFPFPRCVRVLVLREVLFTMHTTVERNFLTWLVRLGTNVVKSLPKFGLRWRCVEVRYRPDHKKPSSLLCTILDVNDNSCTRTPVTDHVGISAAHDVQYAFNMAGFQAHL